MEKDDRDLLYGNIYNNTYDDSNPVYKDGLLDRKIKRLYKGWYTIFNKQNKEWKIPSSKEYSHNIIYIHEYDS